MIWFCKYMYVLQYTVWKKDVQSLPAAYTALPWVVLSISYVHDVVRCACSSDEPNKPRHSRLQVRTAHAVRSARDPNTWHVVMRMRRLWRTSRDFYPPRWACEVAARILMTYSPWYLSITKLHFYRKKMFVAPWWIEWSQWGESACQNKANERSFVFTSATFTLDDHWTEGLNTTGHSYICARTGSQCVWAAVVKQRHWSEGMHDVQSYMEVHLGLVHTGRRKQQCVRRPVWTGPQFSTTHARERIQSRFDHTTAKCRTHLQSLTYKIYSNALVPKLRIAPTPLQVFAYYKVSLPTSC